MTRQDASNGPLSQNPSICTGRHYAQKGKIDRSHQELELEARKQAASAGNAKDYLVDPTLSRPPMLSDGFVSGFRTGEPLERHPSDTPCGGEAI